MKPSELIDQQIAAAPDWRGEVLKQLRKLILSTDPNLKEEWKWGTAVYTHKGLVCAINAFKAHVKINFFNGASLKDPDKLFNAGLDSKKMRSIDFHEDDKVNESTLKKLIKTAVDYNNT